jgi:predicted nucleotidyltransferase
MNRLEEAIALILKNYPQTQAIYLFGSYGTENEWPNSDVDIAILLPHDNAKRVGYLGLSVMRVDLEQLLGRDVDLVNLRLASTVFQKEVTMADRRIYCADTYAADEFEMLVLSLYQKLNEERADVLEEGLIDGRFYNV